MTTSNQWYQLTAEQVFEVLGSSNTGLSFTEAKARIEQYGYNELEYKKRSMLQRLLDQFRSPLVYILLVAAAVTSVMSLLTHEDMWMDTAVIMGVVVLNVLIGFFQEGKSENALEALQKMIVPECTVLRDGVENVIATRELVPGDVVILHSGDKVPADLRLFFTKDAHADEAPLTGESTPVIKDTEPSAMPHLTPADQHCMAFSGTFITRGSARGVVVGTGENTEFGKIAKLVKETRIVRTPLQKKIAAFTKILIIGVLGLGAINFIVGVSFGYDLVYMFMATVALIVAAIPEMLPMIVTAILALAATVMAKRNALIRRLPAAETLGCATTICSDKTGTLTKNEMTVTRVYSGGKDYLVAGVGYEPSGEFVLEDEGISLNPDNSKSHEGLIETLKAGYLCNNATLIQENGRYRIIGDPTEGALLVSAAKAGLRDKYQRLDEISFDSQLMYMATLHQTDVENVIYVKGSPERILEMCQGELVDGSVMSLRQADILKKAGDMAGEALRVLGMAYKPVSKEKTSLEMEDMTGLIFLGLQGMIDPPRQEAIEAIAKCKVAGIRTIMITGDHVMTAEAIAHQLGIIGEGKNTVLSGEDLSRMSDDELYKVVGKVSVYARVAPEHKLRISKHLQSKGDIVAMTGDGVNDAPALKAADIGVAMGITGTEVSKEASSMVLTDDNFASIVGAVEEGRHAWKNLEKAILYTLPTNGGQALLIMGAVLCAPLVPLFALRLPLEPIHILWVNLADSVFLTMPLMMEPKEKGLLKERARDPKEKIANSLFFVRVGIVSIVMAAVAFVIYWVYGHIAMGAGDEVLLTQAQTATFMAVKLLHLGFIVTARSVKDSAFTFNPFSNKWVLAGITVTIVTQLMITYMPFAQNIFRTAAFPAEWWPVIILALFPCFIATELEKFIRKQIQKRKAKNPL
jgi:magnesium-transporting ATPase (P-type)